MLFLPLEEDSLLFRLCLYYGVLVLLLELLIPPLFQRRVRIEIPHLALHAPAVPLSTREFQQRRLALQQQAAILQQALAETPRRSPQKSRQRKIVTATQNGPAASPSPSSLLVSPMSSVKVTTPRSSRKTSNGRTENEAATADSVHKARPSPMTMSDFLATGPVQRGGFSFNEVFEDRDNSEEKEKEDFQKERDDWMQTVSMRTVRHRESPTFSRQRRPVRFVCEDADEAGYMGAPLEPNEATTRLEALIGVRQKHKSNMPQSHVPPPPHSVRIPSTAATAPAAPVEKVLMHAAPSEPNSACKASLRQQDKENVMDEDEERRDSKKSGVSSPLSQQVGYNVLGEDGRRKGSEQIEPVTDFQAFCSSFAAGGSAAARRAVAKRKHHEAFEAVDKLVNDRAAKLQQFVDKLEHPRTLGQDMKQLNGDDTAGTPRSGDKRSHYEAFGSDDKQTIRNAVVTRQARQKCKHDQALGMTRKQEQPDEKTPRIARRISFGDEGNALEDTPPGRLSNGKRKRTHVFGMQDEDEEDTEWRDSLAFRPPCFRPA